MAGFAAFLGWLWLDAGLALTRRAWIALLVLGGIFVLLQALLAKVISFKSHGTEKIIRLALVIAMLVAIPFVIRLV